MSAGALCALDCLNTECPRTQTVLYISDYWIRITLDAEAKESNTQGEILSGNSVGSDIVPAEIMSVVKHSGRQVVRTPKHDFSCLLGIGSVSKLVLKGLNASRVLVDLRRLLANSA